MVDGRFSDNRGEADAEKNEMARRPAKRSKEVIKPPTNKELADASKEMRKGHSAGGRVMADQSVAKRQGVAKKPKSKR